LHEIFSLSENFSDSVRPRMKGLASPTNLVLNGHASNLIWSPKKAKFILNDTPVQSKYMQINLSGYQYLNF